MPTPKKKPMTIARLESYNRSLYKWIKDIYARIEFIEERLKKLEEINNTHKL